MKSNEKTKMDIDLRPLISECEYLRLENKSRRIYCMTQKELEDKQIEYVQITKDIIHIKKQPLVKRKVFCYSDLVEILKILRAPNGCNWDKVQTHQSLRKNLLEETYELLEALNESNVENIKEELGDFILQGVFHICIGEDLEEFIETDVYTRLCTKLISRHTHIFGEDKAHSPAEALEFWNKAKEKEKGTKTSVDKLKKLCESLPSIMYLEKVIKIFDKELVNLSDDKIKREISKLLLEKEINFGKLIFKTVVLAKHFNISAEIELSNYIQEFIKEQIISEKLENKFNLKLPTSKIRELYSKEISVLSIKELIKVVEDEDWKPRT